jgi:predicted N-acetyltransferase YhbS
MDQPRPARQGEFAELMDFIDLVFRPGQKGRFILQRQYPHLYQNRPEYLKRHLLLCDQGRLVGSLAIHPLRLRLEEARVMAGGIGVVGTHPERRGEGLMSRLLEEAIARMQRQGYALSILGGDRQRYGWFGWENGGVRHLFELTLRQLGRPSPAEHRLPVRRLEPERGICRKLQALAQARAYGVERRPGELPAIFRRNGRHLWGCQVGRRFAYLVLGGPHRQARPYERIDEAGGDPELVISMVRVLMRRYGCPRLVAIAGPNPEEAELFLAHSASWSRTTDLMIKILDLGKLLKALHPLLRRRAQAAGIRGAFHFSTGDGSPMAKLELGRGRLYRVKMSQRELVHLFFGALPLGQVWPAQGALKVLGRILPLPLYLPPLNHV